LGYGAARKPIAGNSIEEGAPGWPCPAERILRLSPTYALEALRAGDRQVVQALL
jgi:hypothetical protein